MSEIVARIGLPVDTGQPEIDDALHALKSAVQRVVTFGDTAPDGDTSGDIYYKRGETASDPLTPYIKINNTWWGG